MKPLDTSVKGSPGTLEASSGFLDRQAQALVTTGNDLNTVNDIRESDWSGPASDSCGEALDDIDTGDIDQLEDQFRNVARAERDLEHELNAVEQLMQSAIRIATAAGLTMNGPLIMPPTPPGPAPQPPFGPFPPQEAQGIAQKNAADQAAHRAACADYNRQLDAYNQAGDIIDNARNKEQNAHNVLDTTIAHASVTARGLKSTGEQAVTWAATYVKSFKGSANDLFKKADDALETGKFYQNFNSGNLITLTAEEKGLIEWGRTKAQGLEDFYTKKGADAEKFIAKVPPKLADAINANPENLIKDMKYLKWAKPILKGMPYFGTAANGVFKAFEVSGGQKSLGRASAEFGAEAVGGAVGGWAGGAAVGAIAGSEVPVVGTVIGGAVGGYLGTAAADKMVDYIANPDMLNYQGNQSFQQYDFGKSAYQYPG